MDTIFNNSNVSELTPSQFETICTVLISNALDRGFPLSKLPAMMMWGPPGVGKSAALHAVAKNIEAIGYKVNLTDIRLLLYSPVDLRGMPTIDKEKTSSKWLVPETFKLDGSKNVVNLVFLDELTACTPAMQAAAYQITLDKSVGEHKLPDNTFVVAAGNRVTDRSVAYKMPKALANRFSHIEIVQNPKDWIEWALKAEIDYRVVGFIQARSELLFQEPDSDSCNAYPSPRTWEMVSKYISLFNGNIALCRELIYSTIGKSTGMAFETYVRFYSTLPTGEDVFSGKALTMKSKSPDAICAMIALLVSYARNNPDVEGINNSLTFAIKNFAIDYLVRYIKAICSIDSHYKSMLMTMPEYQKLLSEKGSTFNGLI